MIMKTETALSCLVVRTAPLAEGGSSKVPLVKLIGFTPPLHRKIKHSTI